MRQNDLTKIYEFNSYFSNFEKNGKPINGEKIQINEEKFYDDEKYIEGKF